MYKSLDQAISRFESEDLTSIVVRVITESMNWENNTLLQIQGQLSSAGCPTYSRVQPTMCFPLWDWISTVSIYEALIALLLDYDLSV